MNRFYVIGLSDNEHPFFPPEVRRVIETHQVFSGGIRHHEIVREMLPDRAIWIDIKVPLKEVFMRYQEFDGKAPIVVFASGDPLFYGFAVTIQREMPQAQITLFPAFNSLQTLAHNLLLPYHDMRVVSLTGRPWHEFDRALIEQAPKIGVLTDREHTPTAIARRMLEYGYTEYTLFVGECLGNRERQSIRQFRVETASTTSFTTPNCLILCRAETATRTRRFGIPDTDFAHLDGRQRMITKMPIRLLSLSMLELRRRSCLWDVGFCTGSISIEAKLQFPHLRIIGFEIREEGRRLMEENCRRFGTPGITARIGDFLEADLSDVEIPDAVFIGGHGGKLKKMVARIAERMRPEGVIVFNSVSAESLKTFEEATAAVGMCIAERTRVAIDDYNPITVMKAIRTVPERQDR